MPAFSFYIAIVELNIQQRYSTIDEVLATNKTIKLRISLVLFLLVISVP